MLRRFFLAVAACVGLAVSTSGAEDITARILKYFPDKWEVQDADGKALGTVEWKVIKGGKAVTGQGEQGDLGRTYHVAGWEPAEKKWVHFIFATNGTFMRLEITKVEGDVFIGKVYIANPDGTTLSGEHRNKIIDHDHFEVTQAIGDPPTVMHFHRKKK